MSKEVSANERTTNFQKRLMDSSSHGICGLSAFFNLNCHYVKNS